ncbi:MAG: hypothetical protein ACFFD2_24855 [Promethearchaeota archaeon]
MIKNRLQFNADDIKSYKDIFKRAIRLIIDTLEFQAEDEMTFQMVTLGKLMCYKKGKPTYMTFDEIAQALPEISKERITKMLSKFIERNLIKSKKNEEGIRRYYFSKQADEFGEIFFPLLIWAFKYI